MTSRRPFQSISTDVLNAVAYALRCASVRGADEPYLAEKCRRKARAVRAELDRRHMARLAGLHVRSGLRAGSVIYAEPPDRR